MPEVGYVIKNSMFDKLQFVVTDDKLKLIGHQTLRDITNKRLIRTHND